MCQEISNAGNDSNNSRKTSGCSGQRTNQEIGLILQEISQLRKDVSIISDKVDFMLDILNTLTVFIEDHDETSEESDSEDFESNEGWLPEIRDWERDYEEED